MIVIKEGRFKIISVFAITLLVFGFVCSQLPDGNYRISNLADGLSLTIQGANDSYASVVSDNWLNFGEQIWKLKKTKNNFYHVTPRKYESNNVLSYHFDVGRRYAQAVDWKLNPLRTNGIQYYQLVNERTRDCLTTFGRRKSVNETVCDRYVRSQQWKFQKMITKV